MRKNVIHSLKSNVAIGDNGVIAYFYDVKPINSLFADSEQLEIMVDLFQKKMIRLNMPGQIIIQPIPVNVKEMVEYYNKTYKKNGKSEFKEIAQSIVKDIYVANKMKRYKYKVTFVFVDGREDFDVSFVRAIGSNKAKIIPPDTLEYALDVSTFIEKELKNGLQVNKYNETQIETLLEYIACPTEQKLKSYYYVPHPQYVEYEYYPAVQKEAVETLEKLYTKTLMVSQMPTELNVPTNIFNSIQLLPYPVDIVLKFDVVAEKKFLKKMKMKEAEIEKNVKAECKNNGYTRSATKKAVHLAKLAVQGENSDEKMKVKYQIMFRLRGNSVDMLIKRYNQFQLSLGADIEKENGLQLTYEVGRQEEISNNLNPFDVTYPRYVFETDLSYLAKYNWLGGLYLGEEKPGMVVGYTRPGRIPVTVNPFATFEQTARRTGPVTLVCGESGSGKSQLINNMLVEYLAVYGIRVLFIDPKGDRFEMIKNLPEGTAQNLVIGGDVNQRGIFDPFVNYESKLALEKARDFCVLFARIVNENHEVNLRHIASAYNDCVTNVAIGTIQKVTMIELAKALADYDSLWSDNLLQFVEDETGYLFFARHNEEVVNFDLSYRFNLVTFQRVPDLEKFDKDNLMHRLFSIVVGETGSIMDRFMQTYKNELTLIGVDELRVFSMVASLNNLLDSYCRIGRSMLTKIVLIDQTYRYVSRFIEQASEMYIGSIVNKEEIEEIVKHYNLEDNPQIRSVLGDKTKAEGVEKDDLHRFLYIDYNNRKGVIKAELHSDFKKAFDTRKERSEEF
ncbi:MAG: ATP-binding protein [Anaerorhabdus sp.]